MQPKFDHKLDPNTQVGGVGVVGIKLALAWPLPFSRPQFQFAICSRQEVRCTRRFSRDFPPFWEIHAYNLTTIFEHEF